ncbi:uncharacterized protein LOC108209413 isoform X3 [Daucus carota subsp. sativus]|uniref:uncharacterized protein LOC108209413 isoform X3 n=1 Tax=Daucus carota subsp. sativus TaxID=79200 RepID=UPI0007EF6E79|nr:PREDICTED: uncharacterized protein LOC108209413 isoform X3 [Daucus carota subsp. sativus]
MYRPKFKVKSSSAGTKTDTGSSKGLSKNLSPSQKIIRDYKRSELNKYIASPTCPNTPKTSITEWQVLYTAQLTQKAKKFHDGILKLSVCGSQRRQVFLYDETGRLLDSRFLKSDENIRSGESLKLDGHLVDIGNLNGDNEPHEESKLQGGDCVVVKETGRHHQQVQEQTNFHGYGRSEVNKYSASQCLNTSKTSTTEWQVLYTTQLTQKAKKYHDGILKLFVYGSQKRQVFLYNESGGLLDSRFLKSDENVKSGESLKLDSHLVNIGEPKTDNETVEESKYPGGDRIVSGETEWDAMYTAQVTQRNKKYHSGILKLASCGSYRMQATLLAEDGTTLCRRYLKLSEHVSSGSEFQFPSYLVEVGEPRKHHDAHLQNKALISRDKASVVSSSSIDNTKISKRAHANKFSGDELQSKDSPCEESDSLRCSRVEKTKESMEICFAGVQSKELQWKKPGSVVRSSKDEIKPSGETSVEKPVRDVHGILSFLKKPVNQECSVSVKREFSEEGHALQDLDIFHIEIQNSVQGQLVDDSRGQCSALEDSNGDIADIISSDAREDPESKILASAVSLCHGNKQKPTSSTFTSQIVDDDSGFQQPIVSAMPNGLSAKDNINNHQESVFSQAASRFGFGQPLKEVKRKKLSQLSVDSLGINSRCNESSDPCNVDGEKFSTVVTDEFPSFDLGF